MKQTLTTFLFSLFAFTLQLTAQNWAPCNSDVPITGFPDCHQACVICGIDTIVDKTFTPLPVTQPVIANCTYGTGPFVLENPRWYSFAVGSTYLILKIKVTTSLNGNGIQAAIVENCGTLLAAKSCVTQATLADPITLIADGLTIGNRYFLLVDGINGDICDYRIEVIQGSTMSPPLGPMGLIDGPLGVCPKAKVTYTIPSVDYALAYTWTAPAGSKINGGSNSRTFQAPGGNTVEIEFGNVSGNVCVTASNACDTPKITCVAVTNQKLAVTNLPDRTLCFEELPFYWEEDPGTLVGSPGTYVLTSSVYTSYLGCDSMVRQKITALPRKQKFLPPMWLCEGECFVVNGYPYCDAGTYQDILTAEDGCDSTINFVIVKIPVHAAVKPVDTLTCRVTSVALSADTTITVGSSVGYMWVNSIGDTLSQTTTATATSPGTYYFIVSNHGGGRYCFDTASVVVPGNFTPPVANAGPPKVLTCEIPQTQLQGSGSTGSQFTYLWVALNGGNIVSGAATLTPTVNATGTYRLRVTDEHNGCTSTSSVVVTAQTLPPSAAATGGTFSCTTPSVTLQGTTNSGNATYAWTGPNSFSSSLQNPLVTVAGTYTLAVTDSLTGCTNTATAEVIANVGLPGAAAVGDTLTCADGFTSILPNPTVNTQGAYLLTVTGTNGCTSTATANVPVNTTPPGATLAVSGNLNCKNATVNITTTSTAPAGLLSHVWTQPGGGTVSTGTTPFLAAAAPGMYSVVVTNTQNGCTSTATASVAQSPAVTAAITASANVNCFGQQNGSATAAGGGGNGTFTYLWNTNANTATASNLSNGTYTVTVTDGETCTSTATVTITQPTVLNANVTATPQMANGAADGTATANPVGGTPGYTYQWSNMETTATITDLLPGVYTVTVTDSHGCTTASIITVNAYNCTIEAAVEVTDVTCFDANDGQAGVVTTNGVPPFTYAWSTGESSPAIGNLAPGVYTVVVTDAANCPEAISFTVSEPNLVKANATAVNASGPVTNDGSATASPTGGTGPYTYMWSNTETTATIENLEPGDYTVTVTDHNGCTAVQTVTVLPGNCGLTVNFIANAVLCNGDSTGSATVVLNGGTGPFTYNWSSGGSAVTEGNLPAGSYTVTITDSNNCDVTESVTITEPTPLTLALDTVVNTACPDLPEGAATVVTAGGTGSVDITWSDGQTGPTATGLVAGTVTATATDGNGCTQQLAITIEAIDLEPPVISNDPLVAALGTAGNVTLSVQALGLDVTDNCAVNEVVFQPVSFNCAQLGPHDVIVTATDDAGNVQVDTIVVTVVDNLPPTLVCPSSVIRCFGNNTVQYAAPVATDNCLGNGGMFDLVSGLPSGAAFPLGTTTNTYTYTDADGNVGSCTFEVTILSQLTVDLDTIIHDIDHQGIGSINLTVSGSLSPYTFLWTFNGDTLPVNTEDLKNIGEGTYVVVVTDDVGCTVVSDTFVVTSLVNTHTPDWAAGLLIVPNPTSGRLSVIFPNAFTEDVQLTVFDLTGRLVQRQSAQGPKQVDFDLFDLPNGLYSMLIQVNQQVLARKIVISR